MTGSGSQYADLGTNAYGIVEVPDAAGIDLYEFTVIAQTAADSCWPGSGKSTCIHSTASPAFQLEMPPVPTIAQHSSGHPMRPWRLRAQWSSSVTQGTWTLKRSLVGVGGGPVTMDRVAVTGAAAESSQLDYNSVGANYYLEREYVTGGVKFITAAVSTGIQAAVPAYEWDPNRAREYAGAVLPIMTPNPTGGDVLWVDQNAAPGGNGTDNYPYQTISAAVAASSNGSTVVVRSGTYRESIRVPYNRDNLTIRAAQHATVIVSGADELPAHQGAGGWTRYGSSGLYGFTVSSSPLFGTDDVGEMVPDQMDPNYEEANDLEQLIVDGEQVDQIDWCDWSGERNAPHCNKAPFQNLGRPTYTVGTLGNRFFYDRTAKKIWTENPNIVAGTASSVEWTTREYGILVDSYTESVALEGLVFEHQGPILSNIAGAVQLYGDDVTLVDIIVRDSSGTGINFNRSSPTPDPVLRMDRVTAVKNGALGLQIGGKKSDVSTDGEIELNYGRVDQNNVVGYSWNSCSSNCILAGAKLVAVTDTSIRNSSFSGNRGHGLWCDLYCVNFNIYGSDISDNYGSGIFYEISVGARIESNTITGNGSATNLSSEVKAAGIKIAGSRDYAARSLGPVAIHRNTIADNQSANILIVDDYRSADPPPSGLFPTTSGAPRVTMTANVIAESSRTGGSYYNKTQINVMDHSLYTATPNSAWVAGSGNNAFLHVAATNTQRYRWDGFDRSDAGDYSTASSSESGWSTRTATPSGGWASQFTDAANGNFRPVLGWTPGGWSGTQALSAQAQTAMGITDTSTSFGARYAP